MVFVFEPGCLKVSGALDQSCNHPRHSRKSKQGNFGSVLIAGVRSVLIVRLGPVLRGFKELIVLSGAHFLHEHVAVRCKPSSASEYRRAVELFINPAMGNHKIVNVTRANIAKLHHELREIPIRQTAC